MAKTPILTLEGTINLKDVGVLRKYVEGTKAELFGSLVFEVSYYKTNQEDSTFLSLFLTCRPKKLEGDNNEGWGKFDIDTDFQLLRTDTGPPKIEATRGTFSKENDTWGTAKVIAMATLLKPGCKYALNNQVRVAAKIISVSPCNASAEQCKVLNEPVTGPSLWEAFLEAGVGADVTLVAEDGTEVKAHSGLLMAASPVFKAMFEVPMEEKRVKEVRLEDMTSVNVVQAFLKCIYTGSLSHLYGLGLTLLKELINAAEKYQLKTMKEGLGILLLGHCSPKNAIHLVHFAQKFGLQESEKCCREYIKSHIESVVNDTVPTMDVECAAGKTVVSKYPGYREIFWPNIGLTDREIGLPGGRIHREITVFPPAVE